MSGARCASKLLHGQFARRDAILLLLTFAAGSTDAVTFLGLGQVFAGMMTGNLLLLGFALGHYDAQRLTQSLLAILGFALGIFAGGRILRRGRAGTSWPSEATSALIAELLIVTFFAGGWLVVGGQPTGGAERVLITAAGTGMGVQTAISRHLNRSVPLTFVTGTPFVTGTLAGLIDRLADRSRLSWIPYAVTLLTLVGGGAVGSLLMLHSPALAPASAWLGVALSAALVLTARR